MWRCDRHVTVSHLISRPRHVTLRVRVLVFLGSLGMYGHWAGIGQHVSLTRPSQVPAVLCSYLSSLGPMDERTDGERARQKR